MLRTFLTTQPYTKLILIKDSIEERGKPVFDFLLKNHLARGQHRVQYLVFHGSFARAKSSFDKTRVVLHNFTSNVCGWTADETKDIESVISRLGSGDVVIIDSLAHMIYRYGLGETYRFLNNLKQTAVQQIIALLHTDLIEDKDKVCQLFEHLCTLSLSLEPKFVSNNGRAQYTHKKSGGKVVRQMEEYKMDDGDFVSQKIEKPDFKKLLQQSTVPEVNPETLSTFRIGLSEKEKESRDRLVLPYLPKNETEPNQEGKIFYEFDEVDDWDEEDPDDDLDI